MRKIAIANRKGRTGKSTTAERLAAALSLAGEGKVMLNKCLLRILISR